MDDGILFLLSMGCFVFLAAAIVLGAHFGPRPDGQERPVTVAPGGFPVIAPVAAIPIHTDAPSLYRVIGVDSKTEDDIETFIRARTAANARVKAEIRGIIVTEVREQ